MKHTGEKICAFSVFSGQLASLSVFACSVSTFGMLFK